MVKLSRRLMASASFVAPGSTVADVGCDHAYTSIYLVQNHIADFCIAMDIKEGPLMRARENIFRYGCEEKIETRLSDGLKKLSAGETDTILISGMGGILIQKILTESIDVAENTKELILQPQSEQEGVRRFLHEIGFEIENEIMLKEDGKYYVSMHAIKTQKKSKGYEHKIDYLFGKILLDRKDACLLEYLHNRQKKYQEVFSVMKQHGKQRKDMDYREIEEKLFVIGEGLKRYQEI